ncbi:MAG: ribose-phosphate diphosphokinase [Bacterioplanes sp.]|nr:ribose-phosphate diphosphokinase [Bacterioplanes sp.]
MYLLCLDDHHALTQTMAELLHAQVLPLTQRLFPDGEFYFNIDADVNRQDVVIVCHLHRPNDKALAIWMLARHLHDMGASSVGLVAPYLAYMRQDIRFQPGECLTSRYFAELLNQSVDYLVTMDPHLHRYHALKEIYRIPTSTLHASELIGRHLKHIERPLVVGPDEESEQWAKVVADEAGCAYLVLSKERHGDRDVLIDMPDIEHFRQHTPVLVDDIISTGRTLLRTAEHIQRQGLMPPICIGVHAVFAAGAEQEMRTGPIADIITCNTIPHASNGIDVSAMLAQGVMELIETTRGTCA